jgi:hypothetical protein
LIDLATSNTDTASTSLMVDDDLQILFLLNHQIGVATLYRTRIS